MLSEPSLTEIERKLRTISGISTLDFVRRVDRPKLAASSYTVSLRVLTYSAMALFCRGFGYALVCGIRGRVTVPGMLRWSA